MPVLSNMALTLVGWIGVYSGETDPNSIFYYMLDSNRNHTTGNDVVDGMINGVACIIVLALISFAMLAMALYDFKRIIQIWLYLSCFLITFGVFGSFVVDVFKAVGYEPCPRVPLAILVVLYGGFGLIAFFYKSAPLVVQQFYVISNCSLVSVFYLRMFPAHTAWFVLVCTIVWDAFAVLTPLGPLRRINEKAQEYSDQILRFLMFTAKDTQELAKRCPQYNCGRINSKFVDHYHQFNDDEREKTGTTRCRMRHKDSQNELIHSISANSFSTESQVIEQYSDEQSGEGFDERESSEEEKEETTAYDALNDGTSIRLGMGDFVFYSLLVGKSAASGGALCAIASTLGVLVGLLITLTILSDVDGTTPALPISIALGLVLHFGIQIFTKSFLETISSNALTLL